MYDDDRRRDRGDRGMLGYLLDMKNLRDTALNHLNSLLTFQQHTMLSRTDTLNDNIVRKNILIENLKNEISGYDYTINIFENQLKHITSGHSGGGVRKIKVVKKVKSPKKPIQSKMVKQVPKRK
jgi:hypothetical protein